MPKEKLTIDGKELPKLKTALELADIKVREILPIGEINKVVIFYKTGNQLFLAGRLMEKNLISIEPPVLVETKNEVKTKKQNKNVKNKKG